MKHTLLTKLVVVFLALCAALIACAAPPPPPPPPTVVVTAPVPQTVIVPQTVVAQQTVVVPQTIIVTATPAPTATQTPSPTPIRPTETGTPCAVPSQGGACRFVNAKLQIDVTILVPKQIQERGLTFQSSDPTVPDDPKKGVRSIMGLKAWDTSKKPEDSGVKYFDPAITVVVTYQQYPKNPSLFLYYGGAWQRLPMLDGSRNPVGRTLTSYIGAFAVPDDIGDGG